MRLSVIVPAYNEEKYIRVRIAQIAKEMKKAGLVWDIIVVDDGSRDKTREAANIMKRKYKNLRVVGYRRNRGKGAAIIFGTKYASGDFIAFIDADRDIDPSYLVFLLKNIGSADIAVLSKNHPESKVAFPVYRKLLSKGYYAMVRVLFHLPVTDTQVGCKVFRKKVVKNVFPLITTKKFVFDLEVLATASKMGFNIAEFPAVLNFSRGKSRIRMRNVISMTRETFLAFLKLKLGLRTRERF